MVTPLLLSFSLPWFSLTGFLGLCSALLFNHFACLPWTTPSIFMASSYHLSRVVFHQLLLSRFVSRLSHPMAEGTPPCRGPTGTKWAHLPAPLTLGESHHHLWALVPWSPSPPLPNQSPPCLPDVLEDSSCSLSLCCHFSLGLIAVG